MPLLHTTPRLSGPHALVLPALLVAAGLNTAHAQVPAKCLEIESILVDACTAQCPGAAEGSNEMVRFITGPSPLSLNDLVVDWPNNFFNGFVQDATTASLVAQLNNSILSCGHLLEPPGGLIPAGRRVLLITSTDMCVPANSFANLADTLYAVFQFPGNSAGHFANHNNGSLISPTPVGTSSTRTLTITHVPSNCTDTATYDRAELVNIYGTYGGTSAENDGATARFTWPGVPQVTYVNFGCQAPIVPLEVEISGGGTLACGGSTVLSAAISGQGQVSWSGGSGTFSAPDSTTTVYTAGAGDNGAVTLYCCLLDPCLDQVCDSVVLQVSGGPQALITSDGPLVLCTGQQLELTASGGTEYLWSTGDTAAVITVAQPGTFSVIATNACGSDTAEVTVTQPPPPVAAIDGVLSFCAGGSTVLTASGGNSFLWNTGDTTASITVTAAGIYNVTVSDGCGTADAQVEVVIEELQITAIADPPSGTAPLTVFFTASASAPVAGWSWDFGQGPQPGPDAQSYLFPAPGSYPVVVSATGTNGCTGSLTLVVEVLPDGPSSVIVPNIFSPNGDGVNDLFTVISTGLAELDMAIFNRWGQQVATLDRPDRAWTGRTFAAEMVPDGTYFYVLKARGTDGRDHDLRGTITVVR